MPGELNGFTATSAQNLLLGPGRAYANIDETGFASAASAGAAYTAAITGAVPLGATRGGLEFNVEPEMRDIEIDGKFGMTKGFRRVTGINPTITVNFAEVNIANIKLMLPGVVSTAGATNGYTTLTSKQLEDTDYIDNIAIAAVNNGAGLTTPVLLVIRNALATGAMNIALADDDEAVPSITFEGHYVPGSDAAPWSIYFPTPV